MADESLIQSVSPQTELPIRMKPSAIPREEIMEELRRRGALPGNSNPASERLEQEFAAGGTPSLRDMERQARLRELAGQQDRSGIVNELLKRRAAGELFELPTEREQRAKAATRERAAGVAGGIASSDPNVRAQTLNEERNRSIEGAYAQTVGPLPEEIEIPSPVTPKTFDLFFNEQFAAQINAQQDPRFPLGSKEDNQLRAQNYNRLFSDPKTKKLYDKYVVESGKRTTVIPRGTPEYYKKLNEDLVEKQAMAAYEAAKMKAIPGALEAQAKAEAEAPGKVAESSKKLRDEIQGNKALENNRLKLAASEQIRNITAKPNPTNQDDLALIYAMVRALDPVSAVREGEVSLLKKGAGLPQQIIIEWNRIFGKPDAVLTPEIRNNIRSIAESEERTARVLMKPELERYSRVAQEQGLTPDQIFSDVERSVMSGQTGSTPGAAQPAAPTQRISREEADSAPTVTDPRTAPPTSKYIKSPDGRTFLNPNFKG